MVVVAPLCRHGGRHLLGILDTSFKGRNTRNERSIRRSTSTFDSANMVMDLNTLLAFIGVQLNCTVISSDRYYMSASNVSLFRTVSPMSASISYFSYEYSNLTFPVDFLIPSTPKIYTYSMDVLTSSTQ